MHRMILLAGSCLSVFNLMLPFSPTAGADEFNYDEEKVPKYTLPDLMVCEDGTAVTSAEQWMNRRRPEVLQLMTTHVFGTLPPDTATLRWREIARRDSAFDGTAVRRVLRVFLTESDDDLFFDLLVYTPADATGPVPAFLGYNFNGNHTLEADPAIPMTRSWVRNDQRRGNIEHQATEKTRGTSSSRWDVPAIVAAGYGLATIYYGDIDPDFDDGFRNGIHAMSEPDPENRADDAGGSISAWAWGLSRALDVLEFDSRVDATRVAVFGHSRLGKTSLWAGATDPRFAMIISNNSGCGGAALSRRRFGETVARINTSFPHWFCRNHRRYNDNEDALPVDHHMLIALAAPRPIYVASAEEDRWADPRGEMLSLFHATPVYRLFGLHGLESDRLPEVNSPVQTDVGYHIRTGKHDVTAYDWEQYIRFADRHLKDSTSR